MLIHDTELSSSDRQPRDVLRQQPFRWTGNNFLHMASEAPSVAAADVVANSFMTKPKTSEPVEVCWRVVEGSSTLVLTCAIFGASAEGVELRVGYLVDMPLHSQMMRDIDSARVLAQAWLDAVRAAAAEGNEVVSWP